MHSFQGAAMPTHLQYRQNYIPRRPLPRWLERLIAWL